MFLVLQWADGPPVYLSEWSLKQWILVQKTGSWALQRHSGECFHQSKDIIMSLSRHIIDESIKKKISGKNFVHENKP